ncbi:MAG TPA: hypothetical protein VGB77_08205 [Abditibacteriaceae bacterium]|jgi:hypothetical protein
MILSHIETQTVPDEPLICPVAPGTALVRLSEVIGAFQQHDTAENMTSLRLAREELLNALEGGNQEAIGLALRGAQDALIACYQACENAELCAAAKFPLPDKVSPTARHLEPIDLTSLQMTYARFGKQVMVSFAFRDAPGATAYWLREVRYIDNERAEWARLEDQIVESFTPQFSRVRLPSGTRHFRIEARNPSGGIVSDEFTIQVPEI